MSRLYCAARHPSENRTTSLLVPGKLPSHPYDREESGIGDNLIFVNKCQKFTFQLWNFAAPFLLSVNPAGTNACTTIRPSTVSSHPVVTEKVDTSWQPTHSLTHLHHGKIPKEAHECPSCNRINFCFLLFDGLSESELQQVQHLRLWDKLINYSFFFRRTTQYTAIIIYQPMARKPIHLQIFEGLENIVRLLWQVFLHSRPPQK